MKVLKSIIVVLFVCLGLPLPGSSQETQSQSADSSCREFVAGFYSWYLANASKENQEPASDVALKHRSYLFSPAIVEALRQDEEAQQKAGSDLVSLDGDPFVGGDGFSERYIVEKINIKSGRCWAEVHAVWEGKEDKEPDVIPELALRNGRWRFVNFYFPSPSNPKGWDLLGALRALRESESKSTGP